MKPPRKLSALIACAVSFFPFANALAAEPDEPAAIVKQLYAARTDDSQIFNQTEDRAIVDRFFRKDLAALIWKDAKDANGEMGALDFDPLYYSQDPQITGFVIGDTGWGGDKKFGGEDDAVVQVTFKDGGEEKMISYQFDRDKVTKLWRIFDVRYPDGRMLVDILKGVNEEIAEAPASDQETLEYIPGTPVWDKVWKAFYGNEGSESELMDPLVMAGPKMVPFILEAVVHKDMRLRRYAIGALGNLNDPSATAVLTTILNDEKEEDYFRADALIAIYMLDQPLGTELAEKRAGEGDILKDIATSIVKKEPWLLEGLAPVVPEGAPSDARAYIIDKDPDGLNVRANPRYGAVIGTLPKIARPDALHVHIVAEDPETGWVLINRAETSLGETPWASLGWVSGNMLAVHTKGAAEKKVPLYETSDGKGKVLATIPGNTEVTIAGCRGKALKVKYKGTTGWLMEDSQCANPAGGCK